MRAAEGGFTATLSQDQQTAAGLPALTPAERAVLDQLVAEEVLLARQQNIGEFTENFIARRSAAERSAAGLDRLTPAQAGKLNEFVATALAARPLKPKERPRIKDSEVLVPAKAEVHGEVSFTYGWGRGGSVRGGSFFVSYYDPASHIGLSISMANYSGSGLYGYYPGAYGSGYYGGAPIYTDFPYRGIDRDDLGYGQSQSFGVQVGGPNYWVGFDRDWRRR